MKRSKGFTLIEMLIVIAILGFVLAATTNTFVGLVRGYKQQGKIAETNIEGIIGLELLRRDIETAGFGLPWGIPGTMAYTEAASAPANHYNDQTVQPPRPILNGYDGWVDTSSGISNSDYLVIKATNVARNSASQSWTYLTSDGTKSWNPISENSRSTDYVIVLSPGSGAGDMRTLENSGVQLSNVPIPDPNDLQQPKLVFGISDKLSLPKRPFNRADYMILGPGQTTDKIPSRCAPNTGVLVKKVLNQTDGSNSSEILPLLDCVADMKVIFRLDKDGDGKIDAVTDVLNDSSGTPLTARQIRTVVKEVRVYILAQEGQMDSSYKSPSTYYVGDSNPQMDSGLGHHYNLGTNINYRWKLYTIVVQPKNMRQAQNDNG